MIPFVASQSALCFSLVLISRSADCKGFRSFPSLSQNCATTLSIDPSTVRSSPCSHVTHSNSLTLPSSAMILAMRCLAWTLAEGSCALASPSWGAYLQDGVGLGSRAVVMVVVGPVSHIAVALLYFSTVSSLHRK